MPSAWRMLAVLNSPDKLLLPPSKAEYILLGEEDCLLYNDSFIWMYLEAHDKALMVTISAFHLDLKESN